MPFLSTIEEMALERGQHEGAKTTSQKHIIVALQNRFGNLPEALIEAINKIEDVSLLDGLFIPSITVNSLAEFEQLIKSNLSQQE